MELTDDLEVEERLELRVMVLELEQASGSPGWLAEATGVFWGETRGFTYLVSSPGVLLLWGHTLENHWCGS